MKPKGRIPWEEMAASPNFRDLLKKKARFIVAGTAFFLIYYFALPVLSGYWRELMGQKVWGDLSLAYVFALSQFPMAWIVAAVYLRAASRFDRQAEKVIHHHVGEVTAGESAQ
jgi:uncharacterized membrane protein (DUF485 family)